MNLTQKHCVPCEGGTPPMKPEEVAKYLAELKPLDVARGISGRKNAARGISGWENLEDKKIRREFKFKNFREAMVFVNRVAEIAESEGHHPDISISYNRVVIELSTHAAGGLTENDFIVAAKIERIVNSN